MAKLEGGIFSRPRGKTGGVVFGAARTRTGKLVTSRLLVPPSNPNTTEQQTQRNKFKEALHIVRSIGSSIYRNDLNRAVSQLPGFQSLMSIYMNSLNDSYVLSAPADINLGLLTPAGSLSVVDDTGNAGAIYVGWDDSPWANGSGNDDAVVFAVSVNPGATPRDRIVKTGITDRLEASLNMTGFNAGEDVLAGVYFRGADSYEGMLSNLQFVIGTAAA